MKRGTMHIRMDLLQVIAQTAKPTRIMFKANLSWQQMIKYLDFLEKKGLVRHIPTLGSEKGKTKKGSIWVLTDDGNMMLYYIGIVKKWLL